MKKLLFGAFVAVFASTLPAAGECPIQGVSPVSGAVVELLPTNQIALYRIDTFAARLAALKADRDGDKARFGGDNVWRDARPFKLRWKAPADFASIWRLEIAEDPGFQELWIDRSFPAWAAAEVADEDGVKTWEFWVKRPNFKLGTTYYWRVTSHWACPKYEHGRLLCDCTNRLSSTVMAASSFTTAAQGPRWIRLEGRVDNFRDLGGYVGLDGRRFKQGLVYRAQGFNDNSNDGVIAGRNRLTAEDVEFLTEKLGIRTDLDLRNGREVGGMNGVSPMGAKVQYVQNSSANYADVFKPDGMKTMAKNFRLFCDRANYPIYFHCIAGADRTGALAYVLLGLAGVDRELADKDWEATFYPYNFEEMKGVGNYDPNYWRLHEHLTNGLARYAAKGDSFLRRCELYLKDCGVTDAEIAAYRGIVLENAADAIEAKVNALLAKMTLQEKVGQLNQFATATPEKDLNDELYRKLENGEVGSIIWASGDVKMRNEFQRRALKSRLAIPMIFANDLIHGCDTIFPIAPAMAGTFEPELFEKAQAVSAAEGRAHGLEWAFAPMCDLARDIRWGRVAETCGEDPYLSSLMNAAQVRGFQGDDPSDPLRLAACLKHYIGYSAGTGGRDYKDSSFSEWDLRNQHLPSFRAAMKEGPLTVMSSFNSIDGVPACANRHTLTEILRYELGFRGCVVSDWDAVRELIFWGFAKDKAEATRLAINAGNDIDMAGDCFRPELAKEVEAGRVPASVLNEAVRRVLRVKFKVGLFDRPYADETLAAKNAPREKEFRALAREAVRKSLVLTKNEGVLPLDSKKIRKLALIGPFASNGYEMRGTWSAHGDIAKCSQLEYAFREALPKAEVVALKGCSASTEPITKTLQDGSVVVTEGVDEAFEVEKAVALAKEADTVVLCLGETCGLTGENQSRGELGFTGRQQELYDAVAALGKPFVTLVFCGRPLVLPKVWATSPAIVYCWQPGSEAGNGIADVVLGKFAPEGRLSISVPKTQMQTPLNYNCTLGGRPWWGDYRDIVPTLGFQYWFGYGLTYTTFEYGKTEVANDVARCTVKNTGSRAGVETVQLYIHQRACKEGWRPNRELRGFEKVALAPGESKTVEFKLTPETVSYFRRNGTVASDAGEFDVWIAPNAACGEKEHWDVTKAALWTSPGF